MGASREMIEPALDHSATPLLFNLSDGSAQAATFSRRRTPESFLDLDPHEVMRAQGMPGEGLTHGPPAEKKAGGSHHRISQIIRHSLRDGFNAYT